MPDNNVKSPDDSIKNQASNNKDPGKNINIPGYDVYEQIGKGGMASVFRAKQHTFDRDVALKILHDSLSHDGNFSQRFLMESMIIAKLHHSHVVHVYDVGEVDGCHYIAMEFLSGGSLQERLQEGIALKEIISITEQMASALDYAHHKGIVHRDIKPDNVMFREDGAAVLTDFGIAKDTDTDITLTQVGSVMGTPKYMSPEQIRGAAVKPLSDIYSLGIVFYQMLTGEVPYKGEDMVATAFKHINDPIPRLPPSLQRFQPVIDRMMAKQGADRFQRGNEVVAALKRCESNTNVTAETLEGTVDVAEPLSPSVGKRPLAGQEPLANEEPTRLRAASELSVEQPTQTTLVNPWLGAIAAVLLLVVMAGFYWVSNDGGVSPASEQEVRALLLSANKNIIDLNLKRPANNNAYDKYLKVLTLSKNHPEALLGLKRISEQYLQLAKDAKKTGQWQKVESYLSEAELITPELEGLDELRNSLKLAKSRNQEKNQQRKKSIANLGLALQIEGLLQGAARDEREGRITSPSGNNAQEKYQRILKLDPANLIAKQKLASLEG